MCGDAAWLVDPDDSAGMAAAIDRLAADTALRADLIGRGHAHAAAFTWAESARRLLTTLDRAARPASRASG